MGKLQSPASGGPKPTGHLNTEHFRGGGGDDRRGGGGGGGVEGGTSGLRKSGRENRGVLEETRKLRECLSEAKREGKGPRETGTREGKNKEVTSKIGWRKRERTEFPRA